MPPPSDLLTLLLQPLLLSPEGPGLILVLLMELTPELLMELMPELPAALLWLRMASAEMVQELLNDEFSDCYAVADSDLQPSTLELE